MPIISVTLPNDGETADAADVDDPINAILAVLNGGLDQDNIATGGVANSNLAGGITPDKLADSAKTGWGDLSQSVASVANKGNRTYELVFSGVDLTSKISNGTRLRLPRTVSPNGQCTNLNGSSQYWSNASPSGITFTDDFTAVAWIKLTSVPASGDAGILSRFNGTNGWYFSVDTDGKLSLVGSNGSGNGRRVKSYASVPVGRWVKVSAQLDMFGFTTTTCKIQFDDIDQPVQLLQSGTNPTSLVQAGNLQVGNNNGSFFPGEVKDAALFNALISPTTLATYSGQSMTGSETNCIGLWKFAGNGNDSSGNGNNLTANGSATAATADAPYNPTEYAIVMAGAFSTDTTFTVAVPEGYSLPTSGGIGTVSYSGLKVPFGFPAARRKWDVRSEYRQAESIDFTNTNIWHNSHAQLSVPKGPYTLSWRGAINFRSSVSGLRQGSVALTVGTPSPTLDDNLISYVYHENMINTIDTNYIDSDVIQSDPAIYLLRALISSASGAESWLVRGDVSGPFIIKAVNGYL